MGQYENAFPWYEKSIKLDPEDPQAWAFLGDAYFHIGDAESAHKSFTNAVELDPAYTNAVEKLKMAETILSNANAH